MLRRREWALAVSIRGCRLWMHSNEGMLDPRPHVTRAEMRILEQVVRHACDSRRNAAFLQKHHRVIGGAKLRPLSDGVFDLVFALAPAFNRRERRVESPVFSSDRFAKRRPLRVVGDGDEYP